MKIHSLRIPTLLCLLLSTPLAQAVYIVDTGPGPDTSNGHALGDIQWLAAEFSLDRAYYLTRVEGWLALSAGLGVPDNSGRTISMTIYGDGGDVPDFGNLLYSNSATISGTEAANWEGYDITWGNGLELGAGTYWIAFEQRKANGNTYNGAMPFSSQSPLLNEAVNSTGAWVGNDNLGIGVRISGNAVPEPTVLALFGLGLAGIRYFRSTPKPRS